MRRDDGFAGDGGEVDASREEVLIGRVVDHEASSRDWLELEALASEDGGVWARLAGAERAHGRLSAAVEDEIAVAELMGVDGRIGGREGGGRGGGGRRVRGVGWWLGGAIRYGAGWAVAACVALVWLGQASGLAGGSGLDGGRDGGGLSGVGNEGMYQRALVGGGDGGGYGMGGSGESGVRGGGVMVGSERGGAAFGGDFARYSPEDLWDGYVRRGAVEGRVVREMPSTVIELSAIGDGTSFDVLVERRVLERRRISVTDGSVLRVYMNEFGEPVGVPMDSASAIDSLLGPSGEAL